MFENYLEDAHYFAAQAEIYKGDSSTARRYYRASIVSAWSAVESFLNFVGDFLQKDPRCPPYEVALMTDKAFRLNGGLFKITDQPEYHRPEDKVKFLLAKFMPQYDLAHNASWSALVEFKKRRDSLVHSRSETDTTELDEYEAIVKRGLSATVGIVDDLCIATFGRSLRQRVKDLGLY